MSHVREARIFKILLQVCAMWDIENPISCMDRLYELFQLAIQVTIFIFTGVSFYLMLFTDGGLKQVLGNYLPWLNTVMVFFVSWYGLFLAVPTLQKLLALKCDAAPAHWRPLIGPLNYKYSILLYCLLVAFLEKLPARLLKIQETNSADIHVEKIIQYAKSKIKINALFYIWNLGVAIFPLYIIFLEIVNLVIFTIMSHHIVSWQEHMKKAIENIHYRSKKNFSKKIWPSDKHEEVFDIKHIVVIHNHIIRLVAGVSIVMRAYVFTTLLRSLMMTSSLLAIFLTQSTSNNNYVIITTLKFAMAKIRIFIIGYYGSLIEDKNTAVYRTILYEIAKPKERWMKKHPDVSSLEVVSARARLPLNLTFDVLFIKTPISIDTFKKMYTMGFIMFEALCYMFPIVGETHKNFLYF